NSGAGAALFPALSVLKFIDAPGSIGFLIVCCIAGFAAMYVWPKNRRLGRICLGFVFTGYVVLGTPVVATLIARLLPPVVPPDPAGYGHLDTLVVFDGDNRRG